MIAPYGSWKSPLGSAQIASSTIGLSDPRWDGDDLYWIESRPDEGGRNVLVRRSADGTVVDVVAKPFNVRDRVHEYGGAAYAVKDGVVVFTNYADQQVYRVDAPGEAPRALTAEPGMRFADFVFDLARNRVVAVREDHTAGGEPRNTLAAVPLDGGPSIVLAEGADFYGYACLSGNQLAWLQWNHPNMPWDSTELWVAYSDGSSSRRIAGAHEESIYLPRWDGDVLYYVSDLTEWWNVYRWKNDKVRPVYPLDAEFGEPQWVFGMSTYDVVAPGKLVCAYNRRNFWRLATLEDNVLSDFDLPYTVFQYVSSNGKRAAFLAGSPTEMPAVVVLDLQSGAAETVRRSTTVSVAAENISVMEAIEFPTDEGRTAHAFYYAPRNASYEGPAGELPPLVVMIHGGPTGATPPRLKLNVQFWTSRGFAVVDVNYGGSTGYGRPYRERLRLQSGVVDVNDCVNAARHLVSSGLVDGKRLAITGGSAGGYVVQAAIAFHAVFTAAASHFGISDIEVLAQDTHKFESRYFDTLLGPYPEARYIYRARSPIHFIAQIRCPLLLTQGLEDAVVPPNQAQMMYDGLKAAGTPVAYLPFAGEQHGYRKAENIQRALDAELYFYSRIFRFETADPIEPLEIANL